MISDPENSPNFGVSGRTRFGSAGVGPGRRRRPRHRLLRRLEGQPNVSGGHGRICDQRRSVQTGSDPVLNLFLSGLIQFQLLNHRRVRAWIETFHIFNPPEPEGGGKSPFREWSSGYSD